MSPLTERLLTEITKLENQFRLVLSEKQKAELVKGIVVGGIPTNTFDQALATITERFTRLTVTFSLIS